MQQTFTIAPMTEADIEPATAMRLQSWLDTYVNNEAGVTREWVEARNKQQLSPEKVAARLERFKTAKVVGWVAKDENEKIIGVATPYADADGVQHVGSIYVDKAWHGTGIGGRLMEKIIAWSDPTKAIVLSVAAYNERAKAFYRKWGFEEIPDSKMLHEDVIPIIVMTRKGDKQ
ncbi:MAG TPA: GNAT family N-acetyltransferase [Candidatus Chromulinivoraceae bacterium]|nr:GNAT family N-acetyltransferase [Candidatus Chromulinivoraceae bacterium]